MDRAEEVSPTYSGAVIRVLNALASVSIGEFRNRLMLQKLAYLAREMGLGCGLAFDWYVRGPYSPSLTRILFAADELGLLRTGPAELSDSETKVVQSIRDLLGNDVNNPEVLELISSVWYFLPRGVLRRKRRQAIVKRLLECKPQFSAQEIEQAIDRILRFRRRKQPPP